MGCETCKKKATQKITNHHYCNRCFGTLMEKRVRKQIRESQQFEKPEKIIIIDDNTIQSKLNIHFIKKIITNPKITFKTKKTKNFNIKNLNSEEKTILPLCLDDLAEEFLNKIIKKQDHGKRTKQNKDNKIIILKTVTLQELEAYAKINKIRYEKNKTKNDASRFMDEMENKYSGTKHALLKSINELDEII